MTRWRKSSEADLDLLDIFLYGAETFGRTKALAYLDELFECFDQIALNPRLGRRAEAAGAELRRHEHRRHVVFYQIDPSGVLIVAVVHERSVRRLQG